MSETAARDAVIRAAAGRKACSGWIEWGAGDSIPWPCGSWCDRVIPCPRLFGQSLQSFGLRSGPPIFDSS
jgi:hypothetical protein